MGVPSGIELKEGFCPICSNLVISEVTNGFVEVELNSSGGFKITNPFTGRVRETTPNGISLKDVTFSNKEAVDKFMSIYWPNAVMVVQEQE